MITAADSEIPHRKSWAIILAGGGGSRLRGCTVDTSGVHVPKQYCLIGDDRTPLQLAIERTRHFTDPERVLVVVSAQHRKWWKPQLAGRLPAANVVSQPMARGTGVGVLLPLLQILTRDPEAHVVLLPADHYFRDEARLGRTIRTALAHTYESPSRLVLVGIKPDTATPDFGYIVPVRDDAGPQPVATFVEKPSTARARQLIARGGMWNTAIIAAKGCCLLKVIRDRFPHTVDALRVATSRLEEPSAFSQALSAIFPSLSAVDLSKDVLERGGCEMVVAPAADVGWCELGTPERVMRFWDEIQPARIGFRVNGTTAAAAPAAGRRTAALSTHAGTIRLSPPEAN